ncbi:uncharacterized oxidoreductase YjmC-like [Bradysia coprophila]|uniref:uncharacterized oxidoreductase YjmC-like n=1 Tax=Bradysia coprophila TaxID=38358 RepID=UPI00187DD31E|nr:uncharacterized oxidoreductase YjmC-like [Bradysia coprophila]XP_037045185.1 uncharacterized oxidoreductase YjmC-like [Bradysia coprophila]
MVTNSGQSIPKLVSVDESRRFMIDCLIASKSSPSHAQQMADMLVEADYRGHYSHGMNRVEMYVTELKEGVADGLATPKILKETPATAWVDGENGLGAVVGNFCMDLAIEKAKNVGVGWVCAKRSNHYGIAGWYTIRAMNQGFMGISMTNTSPIMTPTRSKESALGTNPISFAAPANNGDSFVLDMATTAVAVGKIEIKKRKNEPCPIGWAQDQEGNPTTDPHVAFDAGCLMPLGGAENTSGYKGYGLAGMVETMCGISAGSNFSTKIRKWPLSGNISEANLGQVFIAIDPNCFAPGFTDRMTEMNDICRNMSRIDSEVPVLVAGDPERIHMEKVDKEGGLVYTENQLQTCDSLAERLSIQPLRFV